MAQGAKEPCRRRALLLDPLRRIVAVVAPEDGAHDAGEPLVPNLELELRLGGVQVGKREGQLVLGDVGHHLRCEWAPTQTIGTQAETRHVMSDPGRSGEKRKQGLAILLNHSVPLAQAVPHPRPVTKPPPSRADAGHDTWPLANGSDPKQT